MELKISTGTQSKVKQYIKWGIVGGIIGLATGMLIKRGRLLFPIGGFLLGGYIGQALAESKEESKAVKSNFKNYSLKK